jgi:SRSO17 transposase
VVIRTIAVEPQVWYTVSNAAATVPREAIVKAQGRRHGIEELLQAGKGEVGLSHYEVRSWVGWHHHMTLTLLALWFLVLEKQKLAKKKYLP